MKVANVRHASFDFAPLEKRLMNRHGALLSLFFTWGLLASVSWGQTPASGRIDDAIKSAENVSANQQKITEAVTTLVQHLIGDDAALQASARAILIENAQLRGNEPTVAYLTSYTRALNTALVSALKSQPQPSLRARLNIAIAAAKVADLAMTSDLQETVLLLLNDSSSAVVLWGVKASRPILLQVTKVPNTAQVIQNPLLTGLAKTIIRHMDQPSMGVMVSDGYEALAPAGVSDPKVVQALVGEIHQLFSARLGQFKTKLLDVPEAEGVATLFLTRGAVRDAQTQPQREQTVQLLFSLIDLSVQWGVNAAAARDHVVPVISNTAAGLVVFFWPADPTNTPVLTALNPLVRARIWAQTWPNDVMVIHTALIQIKGYEKINRPGSINPAANAIPTTTTTTAPAQ
jgi:hypothetical protein